MLRSNSKSLGNPCVFAPHQPLQLAVIFRCALWEPLGLPQTSQLHLTGGSKEKSGEGNGRDRGGAITEGTRERTEEETTKDSFRDMVFVVHCPGRIKDLEHTIWQPFGGDSNFFRGGESPPPKKSLE